jgi:biopolymer transport protein ExbD
MPGVNRRQRARKSRFRGGADPDLTPLTDCVFLLLIFFMVSTTFITTKGISVDLPTGDGESRPSKDVNIVVDRGGSVQVNGENTTDEELAAKISQEMEVNNTRNAVLEADRGVLHEQIVRIMDAARGEGIETIAFAKSERVELAQ